MKHCSSFGYAAILAFVTFGLTTHAKNGEIRLHIDAPDVSVQVQGDEDDDWYIQTSTDLVTWTNITLLGTLLSGDSNASIRSVGAPAGTQQFYRALQTEGLYDPALFRTISLTFTQSNWDTLLANARSTGINMDCAMLTLDNGATNLNVGARYKGNTSYSRAGTKKSINLDFDYAITNADLMSYETINLNNAYGDDTIMREPLYFTVMEQYTCCPKGSLADVYINGSQWGVYSLVQQENGQLIDEWFSNNDGDRWRAPNIGGGGGGGPGGGGGFASSNSAFAYFGNTNIASYTSHYILKSDNTTSDAAFARLISAIYVLNTTSANLLRDELEDVLAVDDWLWFLAIENVFVDDDSYWNKGADYGFYYDISGGRIHPVEHDGNEAFATAMGINYTLSPVEGALGNNRPLLHRLLPINELRQRYLAHMRTVLEEYFNPTVMYAMIDDFQTLSLDAITSDPNKEFTMAAYNNEITGLKGYVANRYNYLMSHAELTPLHPDIQTVTGPTNTVTATDAPFVTASVTANGSSGLGSVWLYHRPKPYGRFAMVQMFDDGAHGDGSSSDGVFGATTTTYPAGSKVRYYIEARGSNAAQAARFSPARAEHETYDYRVVVTSATNSPVIINELMASNTNAVADPQGEFDDWIELRNVTGSPADLTGLYLSDEPYNPRKWQFPDGTTIPADGYLLVWADEDSSVTNGLHTSFKLSASGEELFLTDTDANNNQVLDSITFGQQQTDLSYGRTAANTDVWEIMDPTPTLPNP